MSKYRTLKTKQASKKLLKKYPKMAKEPTWIFQKIPKSESPIHATANTPCADVELSANGTTLLFIGERPLFYVSAFQS